MADPQIENTTGAFQPLVLEAPSGKSPGPVMMTCTNTGNQTILAGQWVRPDMSGTVGKAFAVLVQNPSILDTRAIGIAADTIPVGSIGRIVVQGPATALAGAAGVGLGQQVGPSAVGADVGYLVNSVAPTTGQVLGLSLRGTPAIAGTPFPIWVIKS